MIPLKARHSFLLLFSQNAQEEVTVGHFYLTLFSGMVWYGMVWYGMVWYGNPLFTRFSVPHRMPRLEGSGRAPDMKLTPCLEHSQKKRCTTPKYFDDARVQHGGKTFIHFHARRETTNKYYENKGWVQGEISAPKKNKGGRSLPPPAQCGPGPHFCGNIGQCTQP